MGEVCEERCMGEVCGMTGVWERCVVEVCGRGVWERVCGRGVWYEGIVWEKCEGRRDRYGRGVRYEG